MQTTIDKESVVKQLVGKKVESAGLIQGVPAIKLEDGSVIWIENLAKNGQMIL